MCPRNKLLITGAPELADYASGLGKFTRTQSTFPGSLPMLSDLLADDGKMTDRLEWIP
jgi:hypothetical protein